MAASCGDGGDWSDTKTKIEASFLFESTIKSAMKLVVEPPMTVDLYFCSVADTCPCPSFFYLFFWARRDVEGEEQSCKRCEFVLLSARLHEASFSCHFLHCSVVA